MDTERLLALETTVHQHMLEDARVQARIPMQLDAIKAGIAGLHDEARLTRETLERHSSRLLTLEQAPAISAAAELAGRHADEKALRGVAIKRIVESAINAGVAALIAVGAVALALASGVARVAP